MACSARQTPPAKLEAAQHLQEDSSTKLQKVQEDNPKNIHKNVEESTKRIERLKVLKGIEVASRTIQ